MTGFNTTSVKYSFNPKSTKYQVDPTYPPNKELTWHFPKEDDGWIMAHNAIRGEIVCMKDVVETVIKRGTFQSWEIDALQKIWEAHFEHIDAHHHNEDDKFQPIFEERFRLPEKDAPGHDVIIDHLTTLSDLFKQLKDKEVKNQVVAIHNAVLSYEKDLLPHLLWEEEKLLPLMRAYFTPAEMGMIVQGIVKTDPPHAMGSFIHFQTEKRFRTVFMKQEGIPSFAWYLVFRSMQMSFHEKFLRPYEALRNGVVPVTTKKRLLWVF